MEEKYRSLVPDLMSPEEYEEYAKEIERNNSMVGQIQEERYKRMKAREKHEDRILTLKIFGYPMAVIMGVSLSCMALARTCESPDEGKHAITLESKCNELNRERPGLKLKGQEYTLQCDGNGNPVLYGQ